MEQTPVESVPDGIRVGRHQPGSSFRREGLVVGAAVLAGVAVLAARVYAAGYGADNDTWLMLGTWDALVDQQRYVPSRPPGYLVPEVVIGAASAIGGHWTSNLVSVLLGAATLGVVHRLVRRRTERSTAALLVAVLAVTPSFVLAATTSIDYVYGLFLFVAGWATLEEDRPAAAGGLLLGLAAAARLAYAPLGLVVLLLGPGRDFPSRQRLVAVAVLLTTTVAAYVPSLLFEGDLGFLTAERPSGQGIVGLLGRAVVKGTDLLGLLGTAAAIVVVVLAARSRRRSGIGRERWLLVVVAVQLAVWLWIPVEPSYLLPALVAGLVWVAGSNVRSPMNGVLVVLVGTLALHAVVDLRLVDVDHLNRYGEGTCEATEASGARLRPHVEVGAVLVQPDLSRTRRVCNERQRAEQAERSMREPTP